MPRGLTPRQFAGPPRLRTVRRCAWVSAPTPEVTRSRSSDSRPPRLYLSTAARRGMSDDNGPENEPAVVNLQSREDVDWLAELRDEEPSDIETSTDADDTRRD